MSLAKILIFGVGVAIGLRCSSAVCQIKPPSPPKPIATTMKTWSDPAIGLTFKYPAVWKLVPQPESYTPPMTLQPNQKPVVDVQFTGAGNLYSKTNLTELDFVYSTQPAESPAACYKAGNIGDDNTKPTLRTIHGVVYSHSGGASAGMCHGISSEAFASFRGRTCHIFEEAFMTVCPGVVEGTRGLTTNETKALQGHLDAIMQSVVFAPTTPGQPQP